MKKGFTLVELVIVIAIVIVLSVVSVPIYRSYVDKAKLSEGYSLLGTILSAEKAYYSEYGYFYNEYIALGRDAAYTNYSETLGIDARGNKYFTLFRIGDISSDVKNFIDIAAFKSDDLVTNGNGSKVLALSYNITSSASFYERNN